MQIQQSSQSRLTTRERQFTPIYCSLQSQKIYTEVALIANSLCMHLVKVKKEKQQICEGRLGVWDFRKVDDEHFIIVLGKQVEREEETDRYCWVIHIIQVGCCILFVLRKQYQREEGLGMVIDQFSIRNRQFIHSKINNSYSLLYSVMNASRLSQLVITRIQNLSPQPRLQISDILPANLPLLIQYLSIGDLLRLGTASNRMRKVLHMPEVFKKYYEIRWKRTGFEIDEKNWYLMVKNKEQEVKKKNKNGNKRMGF